MSPEQQLSSPTVGTRNGSRSESMGLWGRAFRPFFLGASLFGALTVPGWLLAWLGPLPMPGWLAPMWWHGHEMVFGFVAAAIAGFLLTATPVWTGGTALSGRPLAALVWLWVAGRVAFAAAGALPAWSLAAIDLAFLPAVGLVVLRTLWGAGQVRNYGVLGVVMALALANGCMHAEALGLAPGLAAAGLRFAVDLVIVLILVIAGRITPAFTRNALRARGVVLQVGGPRTFGALAIGATVAMAIVTLVAGRSSATGWLALLASLASALRLAGWRTWHTRSDALLWSLHAASAWVVVGLALVAASDLGATIPATAGLHALTAGAMGAAILAVMTRVALGHTGRPLELPPGVAWCYILVYAGAAGRVAATFLSSEGHRAVLMASGLAWAAAFGLFAVRYAAILTSPRVDGKPG